jgi:hypothetical protein
MTSIAVLLFNVDSDVLLRRYTVYWTALFNIERCKWK